VTPEHRRPSSAWVVRPTNRRYPLQTRSCRTRSPSESSRDSAAACATEYSPRSPRSMTQRFDVLSPEEVESCHERPARLRAAHSGAGNPRPQHGSPQAGIVRVKSPRHAKHAEERQTTRMRMNAPQVYALGLCKPAEHCSLSWRASASWRFDPLRPCVFRSRTSRRVFRSTVSTAPRRTNACCRSILRSVLQVRPLGGCSST